MPVHEAGAEPVAHVFGATMPLTSLVSAISGGHRSPYRRSHGTQRQLRLHTGLHVGSAAASTSGRRASQCAGVR